MNSQSSHLIVTKDVTSIAGLFFGQVEKYGDSACVACKEAGKYTDISWKRMGEMVRDLASFLISIGIGRADNIAIFSPNRYEWWVTDLAILTIGAVNIPIYATNSAEEGLYVLKHSGARACFVGGREQFDKVLQILSQLPELKFIISYDPVEEEAENVFNFLDALKMGHGYNAQADISERLMAVTPQDLATIIYTSGTTGRPKGVMLSHHNFMSNIRQILADFHQVLSDKDLFLSFLPLSHALERTVGYYLPVTIGAKVAFAENFSTILDNLKEIRPTVIISVPRLYEKIHAGIILALTRASAIEKTVVKRALKLCPENLVHVCNCTRRSGLFRLKYQLAERLVFSELRRAIGMDRLRLAVSGGGPLSVSDAEFFLGIGIAVLEGFGLTETGPVTNVNRPWMIKPGTVGPPLKDTIVKFSDKGEILIKGPQIMSGYYRDEQATRDAFTSDGFLRSGDLGSADADGFLSITGRIKDIIITSGGKCIAPQSLESSLLGSRFIEHACVIGDCRKFVSALVVPALDELRMWAKERGIGFCDNGELIRKEQVLALFQDEIDERMRPFARVERVKKFRLMEIPWSQMTGELTPTLKVKRRFVEEKYKDIIEGMYM
ncbi:AMP-dependent synthetase and ligase [uncultured Desulfobacterium sp.]|uniref:AMP-dependent synthetase and ligase n=1 Tax=uncultured Desulfobacterium sp. TaxID=201089 RepID=A0A445MSY1_9BACT|nr:AMP-dependent synthetase and ligase [uncultured Desulfobacterium sp.]